MPPTNSPILMALLSAFCLWGVGQMILGQVGKGLFILVGGVVVAVFTGGFLIPAIWAFAAIDAYLIAKKLQAGRAVGPWEWF